MKIQEDKLYFGQIYQSEQSSINVSHNFFEGISIDKKWKVRALEQYEKINLKSSVMYLIDGMGWLIMKTDSTKDTEIKLIMKN